MTKNRKQIANKMIEQVCDTKNKKIKNYTIMEQEKLFTLIEEVLFTLTIGMDPTMVHTLEPYERMRTPLLGLNHFS